MHEATVTPTTPLTPAEWQALAEERRRALLAFGPAWLRAEADRLTRDAERGQLAPTVASARAAEYLALADQAAAPGAGR